VRPKRVLYALFVAAALVMSAAGPPRVRAAADPVGVPVGVVAEAADFATLVLGDPWTMDSFSDVSQYLNESGQRRLVDNPQVSNGLFSGVSYSHALDPVNGNAYFFPLFPGYEGTMLLGKIGHHYPIQSSEYRCLYLAMKVNSGPANATDPERPSPDQMRIFWHKDDNLDPRTAVYGEATGIPLYSPEGGAGVPPHGWRLYKVDLAAASVAAGVAWTSQTHWRGLRVDPTIQAGVSFEVDWVRLTNCGVTNRTITWTPDSNVKAIWVRPAGTSRYIRMVKDLNGSSGSLSLDLQGLAPGAYTVGVGTSTTCCIAESTSQITINQTPIASFLKPSPFSGPDYAAQHGNPWDFADASDVVQLVNVAGSVHSGVLDMVTESGPLPAGRDAQVFLNVPAPIQPGQYRYLSFRMATSWRVPWQNVTDGMIARLIWGVLGTSGQPTNRCYLVSQDIPFDTGWHIYTIDLFHAFNGKPEDSGGECPGVLPTWQNSPPILDLRFDPNENITELADNVSGGGPFHQQLDWLRLTGVDSVKRGAAFPVHLSLNMPAGQISGVTYYYTNNLSNPRQSVAQAYAPPPSVAAHRVFLPFILQGGGLHSGVDTFPPVDSIFMWNTASVTPGTYYLCVSLSAGGNSGLFCSQAPVVVQP
jgi:hypothetical protein